MAGVSLTLFFTFLILSLLGLGLWGCPTYNVWQQELAGQAELARAKQNRQIAVEEAQAKLDAAELLNQAEVARAAGVAEANQIIAGGLEGQDDYLRYLYIQMLGESDDKQLIYIPTEAGLPIMEATRIQQLKEGQGG